MDDVPRELLHEVTAVVRELVTNVVRHARATRATVLVPAGPSTLEVVVTDDGVGLPPVTVRSGLANLADRAERLRGRLTTTVPPRRHRGALDGAAAPRLTLRSPAGQIAGRSRSWVARMAAWVRRCSPSLASTWLV